MPHTAGTHITITPEHVYINGEPVHVEGDSLELSAPTPTDIQTVTLTIIPTSVTILNEDNPDTINTTRDEASSTHSTYILPNNIADMLSKWERQDQPHNTDNQPEEQTGTNEIHEKYRKTQKRTLTTEKQHEWMNQFNNRHLNNGME